MNGASTFEYCQFKCIKHVLENHQASLAGKIHPQNVRTQWWSRYKLYYGDGCEMCKKVSIWIYDWALSLSLSPCPLLPFNGVPPHSTRFTFAITKAINWPCEHELIKMQLNAKRLDFGFSNTTQSKREAWKRDRGRASENEWGNEQTSALWWPLLPLLVALIIFDMNLLLNHNSNYAYSVRIFIHRTHTHTHTGYMLCSEQNNQCTKCQNIHTKSGGRFRFLPPMRESISCNKRAAHTHTRTARTVASPKTHKLGYIKAQWAHNQPHSPILYDMPLCIIHSWHAKREKWKMNREVSKKLFSIYECATTSVLLNTCVWVRECERHAFVRANLRICVSGATKAFYRI